MSFRKKLAVRLLAVLLTVELHAASSEFLVRNWRNEEGLPHSVINSIVQTHDGYLWIGTFVGLVRFDGVRFVHFTSSNFPELDSGRISKLFEDRDGTLWIGIEDGRLLAWKNGAARIHLPGNAASNQAIVAMAQDQRGTLWVQTVDGQLGHLTKNGVTFVARTGALSSRPSLGLVVDATGQLWVGTKDGVQLWQGDKLITPPGLESLRGKVPDALALARDGAVWMFSEQQLWKLKTDGIVARHPVPGKFSDYATALLEAADGRVWLAASEGSLLCRSTNGTWQIIPATDLRGPNRVLFEDREGNIWRGSFGGGLTQLRPRLFTLHELPAPTLDRYAYSASSDAAGNVWWLQDSSSRTLARIASETQEVQVWPGQKIPRSIRTLFVDRQNTLWAGTDGGFLCHLLDGRFSFELKVSDKADYVNALFEDNQTNLWVGFSQGAGVGVMAQGDPGKWRTLEGVPFPDVRCIAQAADGAMWFGTHYGGAIRLKDGKWARFTTRDGLPSDYIRCLYAEADGTIWLGTIHGLCRWRDGKFTTINAANGLWNDSLSHITEDARGNFWFSSFGGIFRVARTELNDFADGRRTSVQCVGYDRNDGLPNVECPGGFQPAGTKTPDGRLWFPTVDGLVSIDPNRITKNELTPPVWVEEITVDGERNLVGRDTKRIEIGPGKRRLDFRFTALSLSAPERVRFRHKLDGLDPDWTPATGERTAAYSYIPPGRYVFRVMACNNDGVWNETGAALALVVQPFFWQTWWFRGGAGLLLIVAVAFSVRKVERWNARLRLERLERQHAVERERTRIAKDIHDDLGANLTQIVFLSQRAERASRGVVEIERWLKLIPITAHRTVQSLDEIVWAINPKHDSLESLANYLCRFATEHLSLAGVRCTLDVPTVLPVLGLSAELRHNLVLATREAVQNVVAHAAATEVSIKLEFGDDGLAISVVDNGRGFDLANGSDRRNGLHNIRRRLEDIGGCADLTSSPGHGTTVRLFVPQARLHTSGIGESGANV